MRLQAAPHYIIIKCSKKEQDDKKEKIGSLYIPTSHTFMKFNTEYGEITSIGEKAGKDMPEMKIGDIAIVHHFVQHQSNQSARRYHLIHENEQYRYYTVTTRDTSSDSMSRRNELYGVWDGEKIIPHKDYIFLSPKKENIEAFSSQDEQIERRIEKTAGGLFVFKEWQETAEQIEKKMGEIKLENEELSKSTKHIGQVRAKQAQNEEELEKISQKINAITYLPYTVEYAPSIVSQWFNRPIKKGQQIYMQNSACKTHVTFQKEFIVAQTRYIGFIVQE